MNKKRYRATIPTPPPPPPRAPIVLGEAMDKLARSEFFKRADRENEYLFKHVLVQESAYTSLLKPDRQKLHRATAQALERLYPDALDENAARLAQHYTQAEDDPKIFEFEGRAGDYAARLYASTEARDHYVRALAALERMNEEGVSPAREMDLLLKLASTSMFLDDPLLNLERLDRAEVLGKQLVGPDGSAEGDRLRLARVSLQRGLIYFLRNENAQALASFYEVLPVAQEFKDEELLLRPASASGSVLTMQGHFEQAAPLLAQALPLLARSGDWSNWVVATGFIGLGLAARGDYVAGRLKAQAALDGANSSHDPTAIAQAHNILGLVYMEGGDLKQMFAEGTACVQAALESGDRLYQFVGYGLEAWACSRMGRHEEAFENAAKGAAAVEDLGADILGSDWRAAGLAELVLAVGDAEQALPMAQEAVTPSQAVGGLFAEGMAHRIWGQAQAILEPAETSKVDEQFRQSLYLLQESQAVLEAARTHVAWGQALAARGQGEDARAHFEQALAQYEKSNLPQLIESTRALMWDLP